jgi:hypothetical protein
VREDGLQIEADSAFQERVWKAERVGWFMFALIVLMALAGMTGGGGPLAARIATTPAGQIEYPRVTRWLRPETMTVRFSGESERHRLILAEAFGERFEIERIRPVPERSFAGPDALVYEFAASGGPLAPVRLTVQANSPGWVRYAVGLDDAAPIPLTTAILP